MKCESCNQKEVFYCGDCNKQMATLTKEDLDPVLKGLKVVKHFVLNGLAADMDLKKFTQLIKRLEKLQKRMQ